ncbi:MAG: helix-turn-helix domain-containing protein [Candidatus Binatus sp.]|jgi:predicted XRE-type DNA-binding protein|uniref:helix-turn-helix domain-containing protein n=1 Tax=Candidatus Binatus sp. TaxID=2811406 RepID=UPI002721E9D1|nr:helix-turn-helix domain-containing protein [Candidatus Binatus sp.]MDO8434766.1 helix-turn-helix domain-containing protein [Candidatus Binatus sp.]
MTEEQAAAILKELEMLRKLKLLELLDNGYSQGQLAKLLGVSQPTISRMVPNVSLKKAR